MSKLIYADKLLEKMSGHCDVCRYHNLNNPRCCDCDWREAMDDIDGMDEVGVEAPSVGQVVIQGWQCPICKRIYSPYTEKCSYCGPEQESNVALSVNGASNFDNPYGFRVKNWEESEYGRWKTD